MTAKQLREKRAKLIADARAILDKADAEKRDPTAEERAAWGKIMGDVDPEGKRVEGEEERVKRQIDDLERQEKAEASLLVRKDRGGPGREDARGDDGADEGSRKKGGPTEEQRALALQAWCRAQTGLDLREEHEEACRATGTNPRNRELVCNLRTDNYRAVRRDFNQYAMESRALSATVQTAGGYTVPEGFVNNLEIALLQYGGIRSVADVMRTASGNDLPWPTVNDSSNKGAILAENATVTGQDLTFGAVVFHAYKYTSKLVLVPVELLEDSAFQLGGTIGELCGTRIGRIQADHFTTGTGAGQPTGIITSATSGVTAAVATAITADDLYVLKHSVDPAYRQVGAGFMMHDQILLALKKLKDGVGRYLWQASLAGGSPDTLDGDRITINMSMDSTMSSGKKTVLYGMLSKYKIRDVAEIRLRRLVERYADADQEGFVMFQRGDGNLIDAGTHPVKYMVH